MNHRLLPFLLACLLSQSAFFPATIQAQLIVDNSLTPEQVIAEILLGEGVVVSNVTFSGDLNQIGSFDASASNIAIGSGMIMGTGDVEVAIGPNNAGGASLGGGNFGAGDADLTQLSTFETNDAAILEFDFVPSGDSVVFNYIFGSEEYNEYVCGGVNDAFGFFLSGPGLMGPYENNAVNLAVIPNPEIDGAFIPVTINSVNNGNSGSAGTPENCEQVSPQWNLNAAYYVDNADNNDPNSTQFDGFTVTLVAAAAVQCGQTYHIKIAIADAGDAILDSGVFLEGGSFASNAASIDASASIGGAPVFLGDTIVVEGCNLAAFTVHRPNASSSDTLQITVTGSAESGVDFDDLGTEIVMDSGVVSVEIPIIVNDDGIPEGPETITLSYLYVNLCGDSTTASATLVIQDPTPLLVIAPDEVVICDGEADLSLLVTQGYSPFAYQWSSGDTVPNFTWDGGEPTQLIYTVWDVCGDSLTGPVNLVLPAPLEVAIVQENIPYCPGDPVVLSATVQSGSGTIAWQWPDIPSNAQQITVSPPTSDTFTLNAEDECGQTDQAQITVTMPEYESMVSENDDFCLGIQSSLFVEGGTYTYTFVGLNGVPLTADTDSTVSFYGPNGILEASTTPGTIQVVITDECGSSITAEVDVHACDTEIPNIFTPDGDTPGATWHNNTFDIIGIEGFPGSRMRVFNRWGTLVLDDPYYNGNWRAEDCPDGTYYYIFDRSGLVPEQFTGYVQVLRRGN